MTEIRRAIERSAQDFIDSVWPLYADDPVLGGRIPERIEGRSEVQWLDRHAGTDWFQRRPGGRRRLLSTRNQYVGDMQNWTIRVPTEFDKLSADDGDLYAGWFIQAHWFPPGVGVIEAAAIKVTDLATMCRKGQAHLIFAAQKAGENLWRYISWHWAEKDGYVVIRKRGPAFELTSRGERVLADERRERDHPRLFDLGAQP